MKDKEKTFDKSINLAYLEKFNDVIANNACFCKKTINKRIDKSGKNKYRYQYFNQLCTCIIRIRETSDYLQDFEFKQDNNHRQAFDFYEFINCIWIIYGCAETVFSIFNLDLTNYLTSKKVFKKSNRTNTDDVKFFRFIRSASTAHPSETTRHQKISHKKIETYPYALWTSSSFSFLLPDSEPNADIELLSWGPKTDSKYKRYYLYISEFYNFINAITNSFRALIPVTNDIVMANKEKLRCKRLKQEKDFDSYHSYLMYLRKRLSKLIDNGEFPDGGLLLADHVLQNEKIGNEFKKYIKTRINRLIKQMQIDLEKISFDNIFDGLHLYDVIKGKTNKDGYISEKFHDYLSKEAKYEIETGDYSYPSIVTSDRCSNPDWAVYQLGFVSDVIFAKGELKGKETFADIYEIVLQNIYLIKVRRY